MSERESLVDELVDELRPAPPLHTPRALGSLWVAGAWLVVALGMAWSEPFRPGFVGQLAGSAHFAAEMLVGLGASVVAAWALFSIAAPGPRHPGKLVAGAFALLAAWASLYVLALYAPALEPSPVGMRSACRNEVLIWGLLALAPALLALRQLAPLARVWTGALAGAAAASIPALLMEIACMYVPGHILQNHLAPIVVVALVGAAAGRLVLRRL